MHAHAVTPVSHPLADVMTLTEQNQVIGLRYDRPSGCADTGFSGAVVCRGHTAGPLSGLVFWYPFPHKTHRHREVQHQGKGNQKSVTFFFFFFFYSMFQAFLFSRFKAGWVKTT